MPQLVADLRHPLRFGGLPYLGSL